MASSSYSLSLRERTGVSVVLDRSEEIQSRFHCYGSTIASWATIGRSVDKLDRDVHQLGRVPVFDVVGHRFEK